MADFPTFPLLASSLKLQLIPPETRVAQSISHTEARDAWGSAFRRRWTISISALRQRGALTEVATLRDFYISMGGVLTAFNFTDPQSGGTYVCRFDSDTLDIDRLVPGYWPVRSLSILQVL